MLATELWAMTQGKLCEGPTRCHWCTAPCPPGTAHDDCPPVPFVKSRSLAKRPSSPWICAGCSLFRRKRTTIHFLDGNGYKDGQCPVDWGWLMFADPVEATARAIRREDSASIYKVLLKPPSFFCLALLDGKNQKNLPHLWHVNETASEWKNGESLSFTINNVSFDYSIYELESALSTRGVQTGPGVAVLAGMFGPYPPLEALKDREQRPAQVVHATSAPTDHIEAKGSRKADKKNRSPT